MPYGLDACALPIKSTCEELEILYSCAGFSTNLDAKVEINKEVGEYPFHMSGSAGILHKVQI